MDFYTEDDFDENNPVNRANYAKAYEEEAYEGIGHGNQTQEISDQEFDENDQGDSTSSAVEELLAQSSPEARCAVLQEEIRLLKLENDLLAARESSFKERLESLDGENATLNSRLVESERVASSLKKEIELVKVRSDARHASLENSYRELCFKIMASEEVSQRVRFDLNQEKTKNSVLEQLVESKNKAIAELEGRIEHIAPCDPVTVQLNGKPEHDDEKLNDLTFRLHATEAQLNRVVLELAKMVSAGSMLRTPANPQFKGKYLDINTVLAEYNSKCIRVIELEDRISNDENKTKLRSLEDKVRLLNERLQNRAHTIKENESELRDFYYKQMEELRDTVSELKREMASKVEEFNKLTRNYEVLKFDYEKKQSTLVEATEVAEEAKSQYQQLSSENESLKRKLKEQQDQVRFLNREKQLAVERENTHLAEFKNYTRRLDLKMKKLDLVMKHGEELREHMTRREDSQSSQHSVNEQENKIETRFMQVMDQFGELKHQLAGLERSKKEQQQNNNLILTLRHQNDTAIKALREENRVSLSNFAEKNETTLSELREEASSMVSTLTENVKELLEAVNDRNAGVVAELRSEIQALKEGLRTAEEDAQGPPSQETSPVSQEGSEPSEPTLERKYRVLKASFKETTTSLLKKQKVLLDSLKKTVVECHSYKLRLEQMKSSTAHCGCRALVRLREGGRKRARACWCKGRSSAYLRTEAARRARMSESAVLTSLEPRPEGSGESDR